MQLLPVLCLALALLPSPAPAADDASPRWFAAGRPTADALQVADLLGAAAEEGLEPHDYQAAELRQALASAQAQPLSAPEQQRLDAALGAALQRYLSDLRRGRIDPRAIRAEFDLPRGEPLDAKALLRDAPAGGLPAAVRAAESRLPMYPALRQALARYRELAGDPAWNTPLTLRRRKLSPGEPYADLPRLARRLEALGDLPAATPVPERFEGPLVAALRSFQERHGLASDGVLGKATLEQLNVAPAARARQIGLSMERLRWTPLLQGPRMVVVNVPEFVLRAYEVDGSRVRVRLTMKVIVGKALDTRTPLIQVPMESIEFSPYWNVPSSIARNEVIPKIRRNPGYFDDQEFEFVTASGTAVRSVSAANLDAVLHGGWRIRQRPGPKNALGDIKFVFPNRQNVYLHHTPATQLFARDRRDFSHGCIRIEQPVELAKFVLQDRPEWTEERIREAMGRGSSNTVALGKPVTVLIAYSTVVARGGRVFFYPDLYGHDRVLDAALRSRSASLAPLLSPPPAPK